MLQIRKIKPDDIGFVTDLAAERLKAGGKVLSNIENFLICDVDSVSCGCGCIVLSGDKGYISWLMVKEAYKRQKLGSAIAKALLNIADLKGVKEVYATGICEEFLTAMGFNKENNKAEINILYEIFGEAGDMSCYKVVLEGYFKPCSQK